MKKIIASEELAQLVIVLYIYFQLPGHLSIAWFIPAFFIPDISAAGFLLNNKTGTLMYNFSHHKLVALAVAASGYFFHSGVLLQAGLIAYAHSCFDRTLGYGLKYPGNPGKTHLGYIGKEKHRNTPETF